MNYKVLKGVEAIGRARWEAYISAHPNGTVFQSPDMYDLYCNIASYTPRVIAMEDQQGVIRILVLVIIIKDYKGIAGRLTSRALINGGPLMDSHVKHQENLLADFLDVLIQEVRKETLYIQIRNHHDYSVFDPVFRSKSFIKEDHLNLIVYTQDSNETHHGISKSKIRQAKKGRSLGVEIVVASDEKEVKEFYDLLYQLYATRVKKPLPPYSFFLYFYKASLQGKLGKIMLTKYQGRVVGGMICPITPGKSINEWYICGLDREYPKIYPSIILTLGVIDYAIENHIPAFDFMGIGSPDVPYGVRDFKTRFGGKTVNYGRYLRINNKYIYTVAKTGFIILSFFNQLRGKTNSE
jgi:lipid II:glycine glycyltransferase (peptidoglycan interpeptide bridge formation enzyme)